ncbi:MAG: hypothetical protein CSB49_03820 [Proteobacteria bacterium]|nr:MAG: hypothetical protein CSB49_03820 [Pseudomonadota bacterium]
MKRPDKKATDTPRERSLLSTLALMATTGAMAALIAAPLLAGSSCKSDKERPDAGVVLPDSKLGATCDAEPNNWQVADHGIPAKSDGGSRPNLFSIWGVDENTIWTVGSEGTILYWDGTKWTREASPTEVTLTSVWGTSENDVFAVGFDGTVLRRQVVPGVPEPKWAAVPVPIDVFVTDAVDGGPPQGDAAAAIIRNLWGVWAVANSKGETTELYTVGDRGTVLYFDVTQNVWTRVASGVEEKLTGVWGRSGGRVFIVGDFGTVLSGTKDGLSKMQTGVSKALRAVWGRRNNDVYAVGLSGLVLHYNGTKWTNVEGAPPQVLRGVWGPQNDTRTTYLIGWDGVLLRMTGEPPFTHGATFDAFNCVSRNRLEAIWGTEVDGLWPDAGPPDAAINDAGVASDLAVPRVPGIWIVGVNETMITGP